MSERLPKILYIDDEEWNLTAFRFMFRDEFEVFTAGDTDTAERVLNEHLDIDVVISDQRMPEETGVQFFERMRHRLTCTERIILTGYSDIDAVIASINRAGVYFYLRKPWQEEEVRLVLRNAVDSVSMHRQLVEHEETLRLLDGYLDEIIIRTDMEGRCCYVSSAAGRYCGYAPQELVGQLFAESLLHPEDCEKLQSARNEALSGQQATSVQVRLRGKDGAIRVVEAGVCAVRDHKGIATGCLIINRVVET